MKMLIMGLPGSGKTTLSKQLSLKLKDCIWLNADRIRHSYNDWDFSIEGRIRQANRVKSLSDVCDDSFILIDMVCPLNCMVDIINPDFIIWMNTIKTSRYENTNLIFEQPQSYNIKITSFHQINTDEIIGKITNELV